jgi:hypothetical protein
VPAKRIDKIASLLSDIADLMRQEDLGRESLHHLRQLQMRVRFAQEHHTKELPSALDLPAQPPTLWRDRRDKDETPPDFIRREYAAWLGQGLTRAHLRIDMGLYDSLKHWLREHKMPADIDLPTKSSMIDRELAKAERLSIEHSPEQRQKLRLREAARRRTTKEK